jgi:hypothetical protein
VRRYLTLLGKLALILSSSSMKPNIPQQQPSKCVLLKNMFTPEESVSLTSLIKYPTDPSYLPRETERDWDKDLAEDVKGECAEQYGKVERIKVEKETQVCRRPSNVKTIETNPRFRARFMSNLTRLRLQKRPSKDSTVAGSVGSKSLLISSQMQSCRHTNNLGRRSDAKSQPGQVLFTFGTWS